MSDIMPEEDVFLPKPIKLETVDNTKEINTNIDKIKNPFQNLKKAREKYFEQKMEWIKNMFN